MRFIRGDVETPIKIIGKGTESGTKVTFKPDAEIFDTTVFSYDILQKRLQQQAKDRDESMMKDRALEELFNKNEVEAPDVMVQNELENMLYDMNQSLQAQGIGLQQYLEWMGQTPEDLMNQSRPEAEKRIKTRILLKNIIRKEGFTVEDSEVEDLMKEFGAQYGMDVEQVRQMSGSDTESYFKEDALTKKAIDFIFDNAKFKEAKAAKKSKKEDK
jgi:trigger factor